MTGTTIPEARTAGTFCLAADPKPAGAGPIAKPDKLGGTPRRQGLDREAAVTLGGPRICHGSPPTYACERSGGSETARGSSAFGKHASNSEDGSSPNQGISSGG